ncbi:MAG: KR domain-containing protein, partial [Steroidobacteraceae bacterium]
MQHGELVPTLHYEVPNEHFDFANSPFYVNTKRTPWSRRASHPRRAAVSSFGFSGTNAHLVIEEYVAGEPVDAVRCGEGSPGIVPLSAKTQSGLREIARRLRAFIEENSSVRLEEIAYTLQVGREEMEFRAAIVAESKHHLLNALSAVEEGRPANDLHTGQVSKRRDVSPLVAGDKDAESLLQGWIRSRNFGELAELWSKGLSLEWERLYGPQRPRRISLPGYPFARERYWVEAVHGGRQSGVLSAEGLELGALQSPARQRRVVTKRWEGSELQVREPGVRSVVVVCRAESRGVAERLAGRLAGVRVQVLQEEEWEAGEGAVQCGGCDGWIDVVGCGRQVRHEVQWIDSLQRWVQEGAGEKLALCVTRGAEGYENERINLSAADRVGLYRMLSSEYSRVCSRHVDVSEADGEEELIERIVAECGWRGEEVEVCYRGGRRYRAVLRDEGAWASETAGRDWGWRADEVLWVSGGTRGIGAACARHFVRAHGVRRVVLTGREELPAREQWEQVRQQDSAMGRRVRAVLELESLGAQVCVLSVPLTDEQALRRSVQEVRGTLGRIAGVLHCAGRVDRQNAALVRKSPESVRAVLEPKVQGLDQLVRCMEGEPLRFFVLFSSVSAGVPSLGVGQSDYALANAYMDYVAQAYSPRLPITSIQWPSWKESGMGETRSEVYRGLGFLSHSDAEGLQMLEAVLEGRYGAVVMPAVVDGSCWQVQRLLEPRRRAAAGAGAQALSGG